jgi:hypothetical protein
MRVMRRKDGSLFSRALSQPAHKRDHRGAITADSKMLLYYLSGMIVEVAAQIIKQLYSGMC